MSAGAKPASYINAPVTALEALEIQQYLVDWSGSEHIYRYYIEDTKDSVAGLVPPVRITDDEAQNSAAFQVITWRKALTYVAPTFCDAAFSNLAVTMTETAPRESVRAEDLIARDGLLIFESPITIEPTVGAQKTWGNCRAIAWKTVKNGIEASLIINAWVDSLVDDAGRRGPGQVNLRLTGHETTFIRDGELHRDDHTLVRFLRSVTALTRSQLSSSETIRRPSSAGVIAGSSFVRAAKQPTVRRVYLCNPAHAEYEAEALSAEKTGRATMRLHWVRGHWRRQWYAASEQHHWKWIDGFLKGNAEVGTIAGPKVLIAKAS